MNHSKKMVKLRMTPAEFSALRYLLAVFVSEQMTPVAKVMACSGQMPCFHSLLVRLFKTKQGAWLKPTLYQKVSEAAPGR